MATIDGLKLRRVMGRVEWRAPEPFGPDGWRMDSYGTTGRVIVTTTPPLADLSVWHHASMSWRDRLPTYEEMGQLHRAIWGRDGWAYHVFAPEDSHINIDENTLHLWGIADGRPIMPDFGAILGSI